MKQTTDAKKAEILFRKKVYEQQVLQKSVHFEDEFSSEEMETVINERMEKTFDQITRLKSRSIVISPYLEIGAERGQRSLVMENELGCEGAATDISFHSLESCGYYQTLFNKQKMPLRICCDANHLPFMSDSVPFVFCYETLHHFPNPKPILEEIYRVLAPGGCLFFDEEPFEQKMHIPLYRTSKMYSKEARQRNKLVWGFDYLFGVRSCNEIEHGIIENDKISIKEWEEALRVFDRQAIRVRTLESLATDLCENQRTIKRYLCNLLGGWISGTCFKDVEESSTITRQAVSIKDVIVCPNCLDDRKETRLPWNDTAIRCPECGSTYRNVDGVLLLMPGHLLMELYPELASEHVSV
jgi:ubiquinone/menaquinone biosynthesis C-methylase UbiE